ncbi:hypothetical protein ACFPFV_05710 [Salinicoccus siamensis]|uniref:hypothetical protein n=1 Tax=Salinicoccus siamensis TaxID=381830 RepID=UPI00361390B4
MWAIYNHLDSVAAPLALVIQTASFSVHYTAYNNHLNEVRIMRKLFLVIFLYPSSPTCSSDG